VQAHTGREGVYVLPMGEETGGVRRENFFLVSQK